MHTVNEFFLAGGRIIGIILTMLLPQNAFGSATAIIILTLSQYISAYFVGKVQQSLDEREYNLIKTEYSE